jgi:transposase
MRPVSASCDEIRSGGKLLVCRGCGGEFFRGVVEQARALKLLSGERSTADGTLIEAWASLKSFKRKDRSPGEPPDDSGDRTVKLPRRAPQQ